MRWIIQRDAGESGACVAGIAASGSSGPAGVDGTGVVIVAKTTSDDPCREKARSHCTAALTTGGTSRTGVVNNICIPFIIKR